MKITSIIAEYNPIHDGHRHHIASTRKLTGADGIFVLMSGSFTERGEPAVFDKWLRARAALLAGADVVAELPAVYTVTGAQAFAEGAIAIIDGAGFSDTLSFGSELPADALTAAAELLLNEPEGFRERLKSELLRGAAYPVARERAAYELIGEAARALGEPNAILGVEYIRALRKRGSSISPVVIERKGSGYNESELSGGYPSARAIREALWRGEAAAGYISEGAVFKEAMFPALIHILRKTDKAALYEYFGADEELSSLLAASSRSARDMEELIFGVKSKKYTYSRIMRLLAAIFLGLTKERERVLKAAPPYIRILGVRNSSIDVLSHICKGSKIPVLTAPSEATLFDELATDLRAALCSPREPAGQDRTRRFLRV